MRHCVLVTLFTFFTLASQNSELGLATRAHAQAVPKSIQEGGAENTLKMRRNNWTVGVAGGQMSGTYMTFADELAKALDDGDNLRVLPIVSYGAASNLDDLLYLRGVDVAVTQSDGSKTSRLIGKERSPASHPLHHPAAGLGGAYLARRDIRTIEDLRGKKVSFGPAGAARA